MKRMILKNCALLCGLAFLPVLMNFPSAFAKDVNQQKNQTELRMTYALVTAELVDLDLPMRRVNFKLGGSFNFNFNSTCESFLVTVSTQGSDIGNIVIRKELPGGINSSWFSINTTESEFGGYFRGGPETYPFDRYEFNFTLKFYIENTTLSTEDINANCFIRWPLLAQFEGPLDEFATVIQTPQGPSISFGFALSRPIWRGYATLLPLYLVFAVLGFTILLRTDSRGLSYRMTAYMSVAASALTYSISIQNTLPAGRYYLSIPEALVYGVIGTATISMILAFVSYRMRIRHIFTDVVAAISSAGLLLFLFLTFYFAKYVDIGPHEFFNIVSVEWAILVLLFSGMFALAIYRFCRFIRDRLIEKKSISGFDTRHLGDFTTLVYIAWFTLWSWCSFNNAYQSSIIGQSIGAVILNTAARLISGLLFLLVFYVLLRHKMTDWSPLTRTTVYWFLDFVGVVFLVCSTFDFLVGFGLLYKDSMLILANALIWGFATSVLSLIIRKRSRPLTRDKYIV